jgi:membrane-associated protein
MLEILSSMAEWLQPEMLVKAGGFWLLLLIVFLETGIFFGCFLPGDSLLFTAGLLCGTVYLNVALYELIFSLIAAGSLGSMAGYYFGLKTGDYLLKRKENIFFKKKYLSIAESYYIKYGTAAFIIGRFLPIARTFIPILAGLIRIHRWKFLGYNILGTAIWAVVLAGGGYWIGNLFPVIIHYLEFIVLGLIFITTAPLVIAWIRQKRKPKEKSSYESLHIQ